MTNHPQLLINAATTPADIAKFIEDTRSKDRSSMKWHLRACETTYTPPGGQSCKVKILFVRSGRETFTDWFKNIWDRARQYNLAREVLDEIAGPACGPRSRPAKIDYQGKDYAAALRVALLNNGEDGLTLSSLNTAVKGARPLWRKYMDFDVIDRTRIARSITMAPGDEAENKEILGHFIRLAQLLHKRNCLPEEFIAAIKNDASLSSSLKGAWEFCKRWEQKRYHPLEIGITAMFQIDHFTDWLSTALMRWHQNNGHRFHNI